MGVTHGLYRALARRDRERDTAAVVLLALLDAVAFRAVTVRCFTDAARFAVVFLLAVLFFAVIFLAALFFTVLAFLALAAFFAVVFLAVVFLAVRAGWAATAATFPMMPRRKRISANRAKNTMFKPSASGNPNITKMFRTAVSVFSTDRAGYVKEIRVVENRFQIRTEYHAGKSQAKMNRLRRGSIFDF
ncbi:MAG: hypothetical protein KJZ70_14590 [Bryobacterales bacterium]|nr:hypothetical protein [Bryobacterales bacterium]